MAQTTTTTTVEVTPGAEYHVEISQTEETYTDRSETVTKRELDVTFNKAYLVSPKGILKIVEFILLLIAFSACANFKAGTEGRIRDFTMGKAAFFLFVTVSSWLFVIVTFIFGVLGLIERVKMKLRDLIIAIIHSGIAFFLLISSALIADEAVRLGRTGRLCDIISLLMSTSCAAYNTAVAFGLFSMLVFIVDAVVYFFDWRKHDIDN